MACSVTSSATSCGASCRCLCPRVRRLKPRSSRSACRPILWRGSRDRGRPRANLPWQSRRDSDPRRESGIGDSGPDAPRERWPPPTASSSMPWRARWSSPCARCGSLATSRRDLSTSTRKSSAGSSRTATAQSRMTPRTRARRRRSSRSSTTGRRGRLSPPRSCHPDRATTTARSCGATPTTFGAKSAWTGASVGARGGVSARVPPGERRGDAIESPRNGGGGDGVGVRRDTRARGGRRRGRARGGRGVGADGDGGAGCRDETSTSVPLPSPSGERHREARGVRGGGGGRVRRARGVDVRGVASGGMRRAGVGGAGGEGGGCRHRRRARRGGRRRPVDRGDRAGTVVAASVADERRARRARERLSKAV